MKKARDWMHILCSCVSHGTRSFLVFGLVGFAFGCSATHAVEFLLYIIAVPLLLFLGCIGSVLLLLRAIFYLMCP